MIPKDIKFKSLQNPGLVTFNGITYVIPGWYVVPNETTLNEVKEHWEKENYPDENLEITPKEDVEETVISQRTGEEYTVRFNGNYWSCTCMGFGYRGGCKHVEMIKQKHIK